MALRVGKIFKYKKSLIAVLVVIVAVLVILLVVRGLKAPAQGSLSQTPPSKAETIVPYSKPGTYVGKYISFVYPAHFKIAPSKLSGSYIETVALASTDQSGVQINIAVLRGDLGSDGTVSYRRMHPELYRSNSSTKWQEFIKQDGTEDTFYLEHGGLLASVSASSASANLNDEASYVMSGLKWR